mgnify:CR=1 FL=1
MEKINGLVLAKMIDLGSKNLAKNAEKINSLNVFPVPDGDTGTNMNLSMSSGAKETAANVVENIGELGKSFSKGLLMGARGNSGVILSQLFRGMSQYIADKKEIDAKDSKKLQSGKEVRKLLSERGFSDCILTAVYSLEGDLEPENEVTEKTSDKYPMYQAYYESANGNVWLIYSINSSLMAVPILNNIQPQGGAEMIVSESNTLISYDSVKNKFYETIPNSTEINVKTVDSITADVLNSLTIETQD